MIAVIPARGGSKRLPRKNILDFCGQPLIAYSIKAALASKLFQRVVVSTEDDEISAVAKSFGAEVAKRPHGLAMDTSSVLDVCLDLLDRESKQGRKYSVLCCLYATSPLRTVNDICETVNLVASGECELDRKSVV